MRTAVLYCTVQSSVLYCTVQSSVLYCTVLYCTWQEVPGGSEAPASVLRPADLQPYRGAGQAGVGAVGELGHLSLLPGQRNDFT